MNQNELNEILAGHKLWLETEGKEGRRVDLRGVNLEGADLRGANLREADFRYTDLKGADLKFTDLEGANLSGADLSGADLSGADLRGADLTEAWLDYDWKGIPVVLGNVLVTKCYKFYDWWQVKTWSVIKEENQEFYEVLYK